MVKVMDINKIGLLIKRERLSRGLTQEELGSLVGVGKAQISKVESGNAMTIKTVAKVVEALEMSAVVQLKSERVISHKVAGFVVACISEFATAYNLTIKEASNYLKRYKGLEFLTIHYEAQHLLSIEDSVQDLAQVCSNNGGGL